MTKQGAIALRKLADFPHEFAQHLGWLTVFVRGRVIGAMGKVVECEGMQVRLKAPNFGDVVTVKDCEVYVHLPAGLPHRSRAVVVGREPGRYIVEAFGKTWSIPVQCVEHEEERLYAGRWMDKWDRRVRRAQALIDRMHALEKATAARCARR